MNSVSNLDETFRKYLLAPTDDLVGFQRSKVKVTAGRQGDEGIHVDAGVSESIFSFSVASFLLDLTSCGSSQHVKFFHFPRIAGSSKLFDGAATAVLASFHSGVAVS